VRRRRIPRGSGQLPERHTARAL
ncbi:MAG: hypothetical protein AVDCRST_MAG52-1156, partial [uncultured Blastococcus sp.]